MPWKSGCPLTWADALPFKNAAASASASVPRVMLSHFSFMPSFKYIEEPRVLSQRVHTQYGQLDRIAQKSAAADHRRDVLFPVPPPIRDRNRMCRRAHIRRPQFFARLRIERPEFVIERRADKRNPARAGDRSADVRRPRPVNAFGIEFRKRSQRDSPCNLAGIHVNRQELAPRRLLAGPVRVRIPEQLPPRDRATLAFRPNLKQLA